MCFRICTELDSSSFRLDRGYPSSQRNCRQWTYNVQPMRIESIAMGCRQGDRTVSFVSPFQHKPSRNIHGWKRHICLYLFTLLLAGPSPILLCLAFASHIRSTPFWCARIPSQHRLLHNGQRPQRESCTTPACEQEVCIESRTLRTRS